eukprot:12253876-Prorocentrum_lima.AAC.1
MPQNANSDFLSQNAERNRHRFELYCMMILIVIGLMTCSVSPTCDVVCVQSTSIPSPSLPMEG